MPITHPLQSLRRVLFEKGSFVAWGDGGFVWVVVLTAPCHVPRASEPACREDAARE